MQQPHRAIRGFTLIEILLVLVLLSLTAVAVVTTLSTAVNTDARDQAQSFYQRVRLLNEEAVLSGKDFGVRWDEEQRRYRLLHLNQDGWQPLEYARIPSDTEWSEELVVALEIGSSAWQDQDRLFEPGSLFDEEMFAELEEEKKQRPPQILLLSSGELTPFTMAFYPHDGDSEQDAWRVVAKENGQLIQLAPGEVLDDEE
ncbi:type II secretion system minor pseudopilin GspH [Vibrio agarilyticus]|uniref:type II secretion system minor pseudopilin GspH n=1 Tax=Vibrio agarilyticus TaxID=2726741 RepID=UPI001B3B2A74|nr:type II secretion system minor pseudopilin GspH [Vibrio agarilyticus]